MPVETVKWENLFDGAFKISFAILLLYYALLTFNIFKNAKKNAIQFLSLRLYYNLFGI